MTKPFFESRVTLGNILTLVGMFFMAAGAYAEFTKRDALYEQRIASIESRLDKRDPDHDLLARIDEKVSQIQQQLRQKQGALQ